MITKLKTRLNVLTTLFLLLTAPLASNAAMLVTEATDAAGNPFITPLVVGATGVNVNGAIYDLTFFDARSTTCAEIFSGCDDIDDFPFGVDFPNDFFDPDQLGEIVAATAAFQEQVLPLIPSAQFVEGCLGTGTGNCIFRVPYTIGNDPTTVFSSELEFTTVGQARVFASNIAGEAPASALLQGGFFASFVRFDLVTPAPVPADDTGGFFVIPLGDGRATVIPH